MPCIDAIDKKALTFASDMVVEDALAKLKKAKAAVAVVLDQDGQAAGLFSVKGLLQNLMPVSLPVGGGGEIPAIKLDAAPGVAKRLRRLYPLTVGEVMDRQLFVVDPSARLIEAIRRLIEYGALAVIVGNEDDGYLGLITESSVMDRLEVVSQE